MVAIKSLQPWFLSKPSLYFRVFSLCWDSGTHVLFVFSGSDYICAAIHYGKEADVSLFVLFFFLFSFLDRISFCSTNWPQIRCAPPASASHELWLQVHHHSQPELLLYIEKC